MSFQQGLSGLNAAAKNLDVIGNNVANASTVGFKNSQAQFADVYASAMSGSVGTQSGLGTKVATIAQQFGQGNITATNNSLDMAINGLGFFRMDNNGTIIYARNGQFQLDKDGFIVNSQGHKLTGTPRDILTGAELPLGPLFISTAQIAPVASSSVTVGLNLDARLTVIAAAFDPANPATFNNSTSLTTYDSQGNSHVATLYFQKDSVGLNTWNVYLTMDGNAPDAPIVGYSMGQLIFSNSGLITSPAPPASTLSAAYTPPPLPPQNLSVDPMNLTFDFAATTQFGALFSVNQLSQTGYTSGQLSGFSTSPDGTIVGRYSNGQTKPLGQIVMANFANAQGLQPLGNNEWAETSASGAALVGTPGAGSLGVLQSSAVEDSNVDLTGELVQMITAQRVYQANAQTIKAQDAILQTITNLR